MDDVWLVIQSWGEWSDYGTCVESAWDTEVGAVTHIVRDLRAELDGRGPIWVLGEEDPFFYEVTHMPVRHGE